MPTARTLATNLLPPGHGLQIRDLSIGPDQIFATLEATTPRRACPSCGTYSEAVHSHNRRTIADLPWGGHTVRLHLRVGKSFCRQPTCMRGIFTERLPHLVAPYPRRTARLESVLSLLAFALGGEPGARLVGRLGMTTSPATLLRLLRRATVAERPTPRVLGVDDWAFRKGHRYGTILVDLERHQVVEVLPARNAEPLVDWLQAHPGVEVFSRDRALAYAEAARKGARGLSKWPTAGTCSRTWSRRWSAALTDDRAAVEASLSMEWSNGHTEGHVNKLKLLKRSMYGRANFDLLRVRLLHVA